MLHVDVDYGFGLYLFGRLHEWLEIGCWFYCSTITSIEDKPLIACRVVVIRLTIVASMKSEHIRHPNNEFHCILSSLGIEIVVVST